MRELFVLLLFVFLYGCSYNLEKNVKPSENDKEGFALHGEFCGKNVPDTKGLSKNKTLRRLKLLNPIDVIDAKCKKHDICYVENDDGKPECDEKFIRDLYALGNIFRDSSCNVLISEMITVFGVKNLNPGIVAIEGIKIGYHTIGKVSVGLTTLLLPPIIVVSEIIDAPFLILQNKTPFKSITRMPKLFKDLFKDLWETPLYNLHPPSRMTVC